MIRLLAILTLLLIFTACTEPINLPTVTPLPTDIPDPTPTSESWVNDGSWSVACLKETQQDIVMNDNPCLIDPIVQVYQDCSMMRPANMSINVYQQCTDVGFDNGYTVDAEYWSGELGWNLDYMEFDENVCYLVLMGLRTHIFSDTETNSYILSQNYHAGVRLHLDSGDVVKLNEQTWGLFVENGPGNYYYDMGQYFNPQRELLFPFWFKSGGMSAHIEPYLNSLFAKARAESYIALQWLAILRLNEPGDTETGHCREVEGIIGL